MELIDVIVSKENLNSAYKKVVANKGAGGIDGMKVEELDVYIRENKDKIIQSIRNRTYMPKPVRRVYIPKDNEYLGFTFLKHGGEWKVKPTTEKKKKLKQKLSEYLKRNKAIARPLAVTIKRANEITRGWINYFRIGIMKGFMEEFGAWLRHKIRVIVMKQWKTPKTIYRNLCYLNRKYRNGFDDEAICKVANSRLGWYRRSSVYRFLDEVYENNRPFRIIRIGKLYRIPKEPFDQWLEGQGEVR